MKVRRHPVPSACGIRHGPDDLACQDIVSGTDIRQGPHMGINGNQHLRLTEIVGDKHRTAQKIVTKAEDLSRCHDRNLHAGIKLPSNP